MIQRIATLVSLLGLLCILMLPAMAQQPLSYVDVRNYNVIPNDGNDDSTGIQNAITAACSGATACRAVYFPSGRYDVGTTITIGGTAQSSVKLFGTGDMAPNTTRPAQICWSGNGGTVINCSGANRVTFEDLAISGDQDFSGVTNADIGINVESGSAELCFNRVEVDFCDIGIKCSNNSGCNSDFTAIDLTMFNNHIGFQTTGIQNVNYCFIRPEVAFYNGSAFGAANCIGFDFEQGGSVVMDQFCCGSLATAIKFPGGNVGDGNIIINGWKPETFLTGGKRMLLLDTTGCWYGTVQVNNLCTGNIDYDKDLTTPLFKLGGAMTLQVNASQLCGYKIATIGENNGCVCWATFDSCEFGTAIDPRTPDGISYDTYSGYELRNCKFGNGVVTGGMIPNIRHDPTVDNNNPTAPSGLTLSQQANHTIRLTWTNNYSVAGTTYEVWMSTDGITYTAQTTSLTNTATTYDKTALTQGVLYYFEVRCKRSNGKYSMYSLPASLSAP